MKKLFYVLLIAVVAVFGLTFSYKNYQTVEINYYFGLHFQGRLPLLLFITFSLGLLAGYLAGHGAALLNGFRFGTRPGAAKAAAKTNKAPGALQTHSPPAP